MHFECIVNAAPLHAWVHNLNPAQIIPCIRSCLDCALFRGNPFPLRVFFFCVFSSMCVLYGFWLLKGKRKSWVWTTRKGGFGFFFACARLCVRLLKNIAVKRGAFSLRRAHYGGICVSVDEVVNFCDFKIKSFTPDKIMKLPLFCAKVLFYLIKILFEFFYRINLN